MVAVVDIDYFKCINDKFGHVAGDKCLTKIAQTIGTDLKRTTDIVSRFGGEEFVIFATKITDEKIIEFMNEIFSRVEGLCIPAGDTSVSPYVTVSIGAVSALADTNLSFEKLYEQADKELLKAKAGGKNMLSFKHIVCCKDKQTNNLPLKQEICVE
jgi:diguanylate cyclase (GGDEF)-like protein